MRRRNVWGLELAPIEFVIWRYPLSICMRYGLLSMSSKHLLRTK